MSKPMYAISATRESVLAQHGQAKLLKYESDYYGNYVEIASGDFHAMSELAKELNKEQPVQASPFRQNPLPPADEDLWNLYAMAAEADGYLPLPPGLALLAGLRAVWRAGCDAGMVAPVSPKEN